MEVHSPYESFNCFDDYKNLVDNLKKEDFLSNLENKYFDDDDEISRTKEISKIFHNKNEKELTQLYLKSDVNFLADVFEKIVEVFTKK